MATVNQLQARLHMLGKSIDQLRVLYEQYFMGIERFEPVTKRKQLKLEIRLLREEPLNNTALKFLLNKMETKLKTYEQYWNRVMREIENGVYVRQIQRLKRKIKEEGLPEEMLNGVRTKGELEAAMAQLAKLRDAPSTPPMSAGLPPREATKTPIDPSIRNAYEAFVRARLSTGESLQGVTPERFQATIASKIPQVKKRYTCEEVEIRVSVKSGKAMLTFAPRNTRKGTSPAPE